MILLWGNPVQFLYQNHPQDNAEFLPVWAGKALREGTSKKLDYLAGEFDINSTEIHGLNYNYTLFAHAKSVAIFFSFYFPGWEVYVDNQKTEIIKNNEYGFILFAIPPGKHTVRICFTSTPVRDMAGMVSGASILILLLLAGWGLFLSKWQNLPK